MVMAWETRTLTFFDKPRKLKFETKMQILLTLLLLAAVLGIAPLAMIVWANKMCPPRDVPSSNAAEVR